MNSLHARELHLSRTLLAVGGSVYLIWWFVVESLVPGAFNPFGSRLFIVSLYYLGFASTFMPFPGIRSRAPQILSLCCALLTIHYFYLFHHNVSDERWVVGCYVTVAAVGMCLLTERSAWAYAAL